MFLQVYPKSTPLNADLYNQMKSFAGPWEAENVNVTKVVPMNVSMP